jgi:hypothetical protein
VSRRLSTTDALGVIVTVSPAFPIDQPLPYEEITNETFATLAAANFSVEELVPGTLVLRGPCPRCSTLIDIPVVSSVFRAARVAGELPRQRISATSDDHVEPMICTCEEAHPHRPDDRVGCGAYWNLIIRAEAK